MTDNGETNRVIQRWADPLTDAEKDLVRANGGLCHRQSAVTILNGAEPAKIAGAPARAVMVRFSGFGLCQKDLCPLWHAESEECLDRLAAKGQAQIP